MTAAESLKDVITNEMLNEVYDENIRDSDCSADLVRADGHDQIEYERMMRNGHAGRLRKAFKTDRHKGWAPYLWHEREKSDGGTRTIQIPSYDVATILSAYREHYSEPSDLPGCFFTRRKSPDSPPTGLHAAVKTAHKALDGEYWAVRVDIANFFDSIPSEIVRGVLDEKLHRVDIPLLVTLLGLPVVREDGSVVREGNGVGITDEGENEALSGVPQGAQMAPLLAKWVLEDLPDEIPVNTKLLVYVDDMLAISETHEQAKSTYAIIKEHLAIHGLRIHESCDEAIFAPDEKFEFLGEKNLTEFSDDHSSSDTDSPIRPNTDGRDRQMRSLNRARDKGPAGLRPAAGRGRGRFPSSGDGPSAPSLSIGDGVSTSGDKCRRGETMESSQDTQGNLEDNEVPPPDSPPKGQQRSLSESVGYTRTVLSLCSMGMMGKEMEGALITDTHDVARSEVVDPGSNPDWSTPGGAGETRSPAPSRSHNSSTTPTQWVDAAQSLAAMGQLDGSVGVVTVDDASPPSVPHDQVFDATVEPPWGHVAFPEEDAPKWAPDILHVQLPDAPSAPNDPGRRDRITDLLNRVGKVVPPGGVMVAACDEMDFGAQRAFQEATCGHAERVTSDLIPVDGIRPSVAIWQRPSPDIARHLGQLRMPWLRAVKTAPTTYQVESWTGWRKTTANHPMNESAHLPRSLAALHATVADGVQHAADKNATNLLVVHHGDYLRQFATGKWDPQKPDLVPPSRRIRAVQKQLNQISFVREHRSHGIRWDSHVSIQPG